MKQHLLLASLMAISLTACSLVPGDATPDLQAPANWHEANAELSAKNENFWQAFNDPALASLVARAQSDNLNLAAAIARVRQAEAAATINGAGLYPQLDASGNFGRSWANPVTNGRNGAGNSGQAGLNLSYILDFWGRQRALADSAEATAEATAFDARALALITSADTARAYVSLVSLNERLAVARNNLNNLYDVDRLIAARYEAGAISAIERDTQLTQVRTTEATVANLDLAAKQARTALAILVGASPTDFTTPTGTLAQFTAPEVKVAAPTDVFAGRPDIMSSEASLRAANIDIGAARAAFLPSLSISAAGLLTGLTTNGPVASTAEAGLNASLPLFTGGQLEGGLEQAIARKDENVATYRQTVLTATKEVEDALAGVTAANARATQLSEAAEAARRTYEATRAKYDVGATGYLEMLEAQRTLFNAEDAAIAARADRLSARITLYQALGGI